MANNAEPLERLIDQFSRFPGIGRKGATRMAYQVMGMSDAEVLELSGAIRDAKAPVQMLPKLYRKRSVQHLLFAQA